MKSLFLKKFEMYILVLTVLFTACFVVCGKTVVEEKGKQVYTGEKYKSVFMLEDEDGIIISDGEKEAKIYTNFFKNSEYLEKFIHFSPFSAVLYVVKKVMS